jgi:hypothetical protein
MRDALRHESLNDERVTNDIAVRYACGKVSSIPREFDFKSRSSYVITV